MKPCWHFVGFHPFPSFWARHWDKPAGIYWAPLLKNVDDALLSNKIRMKNKHLTKAVCIVHTTRSQCHQSSWLTKSVYWFSDYSKSGWIVKFFLQNYIYNMGVHYTVLFRSTLLNLRLIILMMLPFPPFLHGMHPLPFNPWYLDHVS